MKKTHAHELALVDIAVAAKALTPDVMMALKTAACARPRRVSRSSITKRLASLGHHYPPNPDEWRHVAARYLRRKLPALKIYVGGRHVALHTGKRRAGKGDSDLGTCIARIVEAQAA